mgnify:CR=1 FL=1
MTAKNVKGPSREHDAYFTPPELADAIVKWVFSKWHPNQTIQFLEPGCGKGAFCRAAADYTSDVVCTGVDIVERFEGSETRHPFDFFLRDFLKMPFKPFAE